MLISEKKLGPETMILCDTDIFIEAFKNNTSATGLLRRIGFQNIALSAITTLNIKDFRFIEGVRLYSKADD